MELPSRPDLVLGIDGGGTGTRALLAQASTGTIVSQTTVGPSNLQSVGVDKALQTLDEAVTKLFALAGISRSRVASACLGLAGVDRNEGLDIIQDWSRSISLTERLTVANDATLLLAAGTPEGWGLAVIAGTGSIAFVRTPDGEIDRCGGWGYTLGDEGSAYVIAHTALRAVCRSYDGVLPPTRLLERFLHTMELREAPELIPAVYRGSWDRAAIAGLAPLVFQAADEGDDLARSILRSEAELLSATASTAVRKIGLSLENVPLALAGGVMLGSETYREIFLEALQSKGVTTSSVQLVRDPALGAIILARREIA